jgi:hypothetical protein
MIANKKTTARIAGFLYLSIFVIAPLSLLVLPSRLVVPGDAAATVTNIRASEFLFRIGVVGDSVLFLIEIALSATFYVLLRQVNKPLSLVAAFSRLGEAFIMGINVLVHIVVLHLLGGATYLAAFETEQLHALVSLLLQVHDDGILVSQVFFGLHLITLGYLLYKSSFFPRILGVMLVFASFGYLIESFGNFLFPSYEEIYAWVVIALAAVPEFSLTLWLIVKGVRTPRRADPTPVPPRPQPI